MRKLAIHPAALAISAVATTASRLGTTGNEICAFSRRFSNRFANPLASKRAHHARHRAENQKLHREDPADAPARGAQSLENHHFAHPAEARAGHARRQNDGACENREQRNETDHGGDLVHHALEDLQNVGQVHHCYGRKTAVQNLLKCGDRGGLRAEAAIVDQREAVETRRC